MISLADDYFDAHDLYERKDSAKQEQKKFLIFKMTCFRKEVFR